MSREFCFFLQINPEPWTTGTATPFKNRTTGKWGARVHKDEGVSVYQNAVKAAMDDEIANPFDADTEIELEFYFWRQLAVYEGDNGRVQRHQADATNMQKALEDALQGSLFPNDRQVVHVSSWIMEQSPTTEPLILVRARQAPDVPADVVALAKQRIGASPRGAANDRQIDVKGLF